MARTRSIRRNRKSSKKKQNGILQYLPETLQAFIARRIIDIVASALALSSIFILCALLSYTAADPSWNTAADQDSVISNWMGLKGAVTADLLLQTIGVGAVLFTIIPFIWSIRCFNRQSLKPLTLRLLGLGISAFALSVACANIPSSNWLAQPSLGSSFSALFLTWIETPQTPLSFLNPATASLLAGFIALSSGLYAAAIKKEEFISFILHSYLYIKASLIYIAGIIEGFNSWIKHHNDPHYRPDPMSVLGTFPKISVKLPKAEITSKPAHSSTQKTTNIEPSTSLEIAPAAKSINTEKPQTNIPVVTPQASTPTPQSKQTNFSLDGENWEFPSIELLETPPIEQTNANLNEDALRKNAELLQNVLADFNIEGEITSIHPGPVVTLYELEPAPGTKSAKVIGLADDIARSMSAISVRVAVVPGRNVIGIELPNKLRQTVYMQELLTTRMYEKTEKRLPLILGKDIGGQPILADLAKMPHLLVAGTTGSGKSVAVNTMILSLLYRLSPEKCRFIMIDPKMLELSVYDGIPHLLTPVVTEPGKAVVALKWTVNEMEERYRAMSKLGVRNIDGYNARIREALSKDETIMKKVQTGFDPETGAAIYEDQPMELAELPYIVVIVDEFADLMLVAGKDVENAIQRLAQMARAAGIHLIMATQRPSVDVITGVIKANFPTRISFQVTSKVDSRTILGEGGAEQLLGMGDMLYMAPGGRVTRVHGPFVSDPDVEKVVNELKLQAEPSYIESITSGEGLDASEVMNAIFEDRSGDEKVDALYDQAVAVVAREGKASTSFIQRHLQIGYNRAARIMEEMERQGVVSPANSTGKRQILISDFSEA